MQVTAHAPIGVVAHATNTCIRMVVTLADIAPAWDRTPSSRGSMRRFVALLVFATAVACGGDSTSPSATVSGTYTLQNVNGSQLPFTVFDVGTEKYEILTDAVILNEGGTWTESGTDRSTVSGQVTTSTITDAGTYTLNGTAITFVSAQSGTTNGSVGSGTLTITDQGIVAVYQK
jgi:hypothetical protein